MERMKREGKMAESGEKSIHVEGKQWSSQGGKGRPSVAVGPVVVAQTNATIDLGSLE